MHGVVIDPVLLAEAEALNVDVASAASRGVEQAVRAARHSQWRDENHAALASSNTFVEKNGLPLARHRLF
ncbi:type II toxin-antitoxin system CcdA family antitoxin [Mangrovibrevibacter kandeliae]|uniref:type II toxin-antitoxin system CcdA family antitoxin n=1 Tax=Mangrovibrevibacter kandeliae TaxID=2968473 RepID=UPI0021179891|nr:type II toxin-antitoxin system CcdA family antitoxin [Aurantimonas sp. CSK15Z-1]MCQ8783110.1 type II toxin-antitoxin system CcdA family antitoxin [Aurantimonas sp. CSK15Z-1]